MVNEFIQLKFSHNSQAQYTRGNGLLLSGITESIESEYLEKNVVSVLSDIDVTVKPSEIEDCHRLGKSNSQDHTNKTIV